MTAVTDPQAWGVANGYSDAAGVWHVAGDDVVAAVLGAMGAADGVPAPGKGAGRRGPLVVRLDRAPPILGSGKLTTEDGGDVRVEGHLPRDLPPGYHTFEADGAEPVMLIASPGRCPPPQRRQWGWAAQLYAVRSRRSWGIGDLGDLAELSRWSSQLGAGMVIINPLHAAAPAAHQQPSPYFPASRCFRSPLYLRVEDIPGAGEVAGIADLAASGRALNAGRIIDRDRVWELKSKALAEIFEAQGGEDSLDAFAASRGESLQLFATWCALAERHDGPWQKWPRELRSPSSPAVASFAGSAGGMRRIRFHTWLQWQVEQQLATAAGKGTALVQDLAIGVDPGGADAWMWQGCFAPEVRVGAPPDEFNTRGQDWSLPPWDPWKLRAAGYGPYVETIRAGMRSAGGLRFDHVMGLFRLWWIPAGNEPADGVYVSYPSSDLLDILALEAHRAGAYIIGEDLGTVEPEVRSELAARGVLSYRLLWFEEQRPDTWPLQALGAVSTHDLPTVSGVWSGSDLRAQTALGLKPNEEAGAALRRRLAQWGGARDGATSEEVVAAAYALLARAPSMLLSATLEDVCGVEERPNMPGTTHEWPNWRRALPLTLEDLEQLPSARAIAGLLSRHP